MPRDSSVLSLIGLVSPSGARDLRWHAEHEEILRFAQDDHASHGHLSPPPCCHARRCRPKYENRMAARRKGTIAMASAAPSPRLPPGIARWNDSVAMR